MFAPFVRLFGCRIRCRMIYAVAKSEIVHIICEHNLEIFGFSGFCVLFEYLAPYMVRRVVCGWCAQTVNKKGINMACCIRALYTQIWTFLKCPKTSSDRPVKAAKFAYLLFVTIFFKF
jgi:hypothetical protein